MTAKEAAVIQIFTGTVMLKGDQLKYAYEYASKLIGRPIYTHEFYTLEEELKERSREDFIEICKNLTEENKDDKNQRCPVGGVDRTQKVDKISLQNAVETPFWMAVWAAEPGREIEVRMSYDDLKIICDLIDGKRKDRWIPVEERQPEDGEEVLCCDDRSDIP